MYQLRCTKKSQDLLGLRPQDLSDIESEHHILGNWYMHTFTQERRKLLGHVNDKMSLYQDFIYSDGGFEHCDLAQTTAKINRMPQKELGWALSIDVFNELFN
ncbi:hypothetical protein BK412_13965 [Vibrio campbellii]|uniref:DUF6933 domain-containing protein n=1 Tax=Vibrio campbellii TaxID=680 RepID=UPI0009BFF4B2|nr:hypothetical protein [Vibrio campbellii]OQQ02376.1 hypothetical protein BK412_13965 [Vibrio campbellii]